MNITFSFQNGTSKIHLTPQNARDERYLELCIDGKPNVSICAGKDKELIIGFEAPKEIVKEKLVDTCFCGTGRFCDLHKDLPK